MKILRGEEKIKEEDDKKRGDEFLFAFASSFVVFSCRHFLGERAIRCICVPHCRLLISFFGSFNCLESSRALRRSSLAANFSASLQWRQTMMLCLGSSSCLLLNSFLSLVSPDRRRRQQKKERRREGGREKWIRSIFLITSSSLASDRCIQVRCVPAFKNIRPLAFKVALIVCKTRV